MLDLGVLLPATIAACVGLARERAWAHEALYLVVGWFGLVGPAVAAMAIAMYANDDPNASGAEALFMTALGLAFAILALVVYLPLFGSRGGLILAAPTETGSGSSARGRGSPSLLPSRRRT
jgi:NhaP-type Na+/H+ or K+/H+ antiporter